MPDYQSIVTSMVCLLLYITESTTENSQSAITGGHNTISKHTVTPASSNRLNTDAVIAGASGVIGSVLLLLASFTVVVLIVYGVQKRKKCTQESDDPAGIR